MQKKINIQNKRARFEYEIIDQYTAGLVLTGTEIKSIRESKASITESFCEFNERGELFACFFDYEINIRTYEKNCFILKSTLFLNRLLFAKSK